MQELASESKCMTSLNCAADEPDVVSKLICYILNRVAFGFSLFVEVPHGVDCVLTPFVQRLDQSDVM